MKNTQESFYQMLKRMEGERQLLKEAHKRYFPQMSDEVFINYVNTAVVGIFIGVGFGLVYYYFPDLAVFALQRYAKAYQISADSLKTLLEGLGKEYVELTAAQNSSTISTESSAQLVEGIAKLKQQIDIKNLELIVAQQKVSSINLEVEDFRKLSEALSKSPILHKGAAFAVVLGIAVIAFKFLSVGLSK